MKKWGIFWIFFAYVLNPRPSGTLLKGGQGGFEDPPCAKYALRN